MNILIGCEESGVVRRAFAAEGHNAWSCDIIPARDGSSNHLQCDVKEAISSRSWDFIVLHPPCTHIAVSGNRWYAGTPERQQAVEWTIDLWERAKARCARVCLENPVGLKIPGAKPQWIQPWMFGHAETKKTGLWLHGLPHLEPTEVVTPLEQRVWRMAPGPNRQRDRSETYKGIARAMAQQWGRK